MTASAAEWLAQNSIDCQPLGARISKEQCKANHGRLFACETCPLGGVKYTGPAKITRKVRGKQAPVIVDEYIAIPQPALAVATVAIVQQDTVEPVKKRGTKPVKWPFTPHMNAVIRETYRTETANGTVNKLAATFGYPRWAVSKQARTIGAYEVRCKEPDWSDVELRVMSNNAHLTPERIQRALRLAGFKRSIAGIILKRKRMRMPANLKGQSANTLSECFGIDPKAITAWIKKGWLKAERRGTHRTERQGGDMWFIRNKDLRQFIIENIGVIDIRKVDKFWLIDVLTLKEAA